nr:zinc finger, CCHC-type [Tanacetum cinerariifolium]
MSEGKNKEIIVHKEVTSLSQFQFPILKSINYTVWALSIKTILWANGLLDVIEPSDNAQLDIKKDMAATAYLYQALPEDMILQVASCNSAKKIWEALQTRHIVQEKRDKGKKIFLKKKEIKPKDYISTDESLWYLDNGASNHMTGIRTHFKEIDEKISGRVRFDEALETFKEFKLKVENEVGKKLKSFRTDRGGEFTSREFIRYCKENEILRQLTAPYSPQQNGVVERRNRSVMSTTKSMLKAMNMPQIFWDEAIRHAVYVLNRVSTKALKDSTPYKALKGRKPNMRYLRVFGCKAYAKVTKPHLKKLDDRSKELVYLGTQPGSKVYRLFDPVTKDMVVSRDVKFKEDKGWDWKGYLDNINPSKPKWRDFIISENQTSSSRIIDEVSTQDSKINNEDSAPNPIQNNAHDDIYDDDEIEQPIDNPSTPPPYTYKPDSEDSTEHTSSIASSSRPLDHTPVRGYRKLYEIYNRAPKVQSNELLLLEEEPRNYKEAVQDKKWIEAMQIEIDSINKNKTWKLATLPDNQKAIGLKWVLKTKRDGNGNIIKHKARLVAKGYVQEHGIDYDEFFAPVARMETIRLILALSAYHGWEVHHLDVKSAFLHGELKEEVYVTQPEGFKKPRNENKVYRLVKALY